MKRALFLALTLALLVASAANAQVTQPTPSPDPRLYTDPGMTFLAPPDAVLVNRQQMSPSDLSEDLQRPTVLTQSLGGHAHRQLIRNRAVMLNPKKPTRIYETPDLITPGTPGSYEHPG